MDPALLQLLAKVLPAQGLVLEVASGAGDRVVALAQQFGNLAWQASERAPEAVAALVARRDAAGLTNLLRPVELDVTLLPWPIAQADAVVCFDHAHVVPLDTLAALFAGAARTLGNGGLLFFHGPFRFHGKYATPSVQELDLSLRARDPSLGVRDIRELTVCGTRTGFGLEHAIATPGHAHALVFRRRPLLPPTGQFRV